MDQLAIRILIENWALWRDTGQWDKLRSTFHPGATITVTWFDGPFEEFVEASARARAGGRLSQHVLGGTTAAIQADRAIAQTRMTIQLRGLAGDVEVDVAATGRFFDRVERRDGEWRIRKRAVIYEKSRMDPVVPGARLDLDQQILERFPRGYCHLAYLQVQAGMRTLPDLPTATGPAVDRLLTDAGVWLAGAGDPPTR
jgi:hypothetical protein